MEKSHVSAHNEILSISDCKMVEAICGFSTARYQLINVYKIVYLQYEKEKRTKN
jgi:hypothetical protein